MYHLRRYVAVSTLALAARPAVWSQRAPDFLGRWGGESECLGTRPACRAEHVVYEIGAAGAGALTVRGARVAGSDTVEMGALACRVAAARAEATCRVALGVWRFRLAGDQLEGWLTLADSTIGRHVVARRLARR